MYPSIQETLCLFLSLISLFLVYSVALRKFNWVTVRTLANSTKENFIRSLSLSCSLSLPLFLFLSFSCLLFHVRYFFCFSSFCKISAYSRMSALGGCERAHKFTHVCRGTYTVRIMRWQEKCIRKKKAGESSLESFYLFVYLWIYLFIFPLTIVVKSELKNNCLACKWILHGAIDMASTRLPARYIYVLCMLRTQPVMPDWESCGLSNCAKKILRQDYLSNLASLNPAGSEDHVNFVVTTKSWCRLFSYTDECVAVFFSSRYQSTEPCYPAVFRVYTARVL